MFLDVVIQEACANFQGGMRLDTCQVQVLPFVDDTVLVAEAEEELAHITSEHSKKHAVKEHKLAVNWGKTTQWHSAESTLLVRWRLESTA